MKEGKTRKEKIGYDEEEIWKVMSSDFGQGQCFHVHNNAQYSTDQIKINYLL